MDFKFSYTHIISHIIPGILLGIELLMFLYLIIPITMVSNFFTVLRNGVVVVSFVIFAATFLGILIDAFQHLLFEDLELIHFFIKLFSKIPIVNKNIEVCEDKEVFEGNIITNKEHLFIFNDLVMESYYYYYEAWVNCSLTLTIGLFIMPPFMNKLGFNSFFIFLSEIILLFILLILFGESVITYSQYQLKRKKVLESFNK